MKPAPPMSSAAHCRGNATGRGCSCCAVVFAPAPGGVARTPTESRRSNGARSALGTGPFRHRRECRLHPGRPRDRNDRRQGSSTTCDMGPPPGQTGDRRCRAATPQSRKKRHLVASRAKRRSPRPGRWLHRRRGSGPVAAWIAHRLQVGTAATTSPRLARPRTGSSR